MLDDLGLVGQFQVASFHPAYQFANTRVNAAENFTNRSPYPMLHLLREEAVETAVAHHPTVKQIPEKNIQLMNEMGAQRLMDNLARISE